MKRIFAILIALLVALPAAFASAEEFVLEGVVTEMTETGFLMTDAELGLVEVHVEEDTKLEGMLTDEAIALGQYVIVVYDGKMTRSLPPQVTADKVSCFYVQGTVSEMIEDSALITGDATWGDVYAALGENMPQLHIGNQVTVYFNGVMALSLPAQIGALYVKLPTVMGVVSELTGEGFLVTSEDGTPYEVQMTEETECFLLENGQTVIVTYSGQLTKSIPAQLTAYTVENALAKADNGSL